MKAFQTGELCHLGSELLAFHWRERILVLQLRDQELQKLLLIQKTLPGCAFTWKRLLASDRLYEISHGFTPFLGHKFNGVITEVSDACY